MNQNFLKNILKYITEGIIGVKINNTVCMFNESAQMISGYSIDEIMDHNISDFFNLTLSELTANKTNIIDRLDDAQFRKVFTTSDALVECKRDGRIHKGIVAPVRSETVDDILIGIIVIFSDVEQQINELEQLQKDLREKSMTQVAGGIAHDLNNILTVIWNNIDMVKTEMKKDTEEYKLLKEIDSLINRASTLTEQLLYFSRERRVLESYTSISEFLKKFVPINFIGTNIITKFDLEEDLAPIKIEKIEMTHLIRNIIQNSIDAMPNGGTFTVKAKNATVSQLSNLALTPGAYVKIELGDTGIGIPEDCMSLIFEPYFTMKQDGESKGLGLPIAKIIMEKNNGCIKIESKKDQGTKVILYF
ncbi:MAG: PAS domain S-box protein, partial [Candidatus Lokiarchaeota archaeon]|nr:PAS domain S-box protein [Candidatus Lokiarchaeota archaeon]